MGGGGRQGSQNTSNRKTHFFVNRVSNCGRLTVARNYFRNTLIMMFTLMLPSFACLPYIIDLPESMRGWAASSSPPWPACPCSAPCACPAPGPPPAPGYCPSRREGAAHPYPGSSAVWPGSSRWTGTARPTPEQQFHLLASVFRIRIHLVRIRSKHLSQNTDPDPIRIRIQSFDGQKFTAEKI